MLCGRCFPINGAAIGIFEVAHEICSRCRELLANLSVSSCVGPGVLSIDHLIRKRFSQAQESITPHQEMKSATALLAALLALSAADGALAQTADRAESIIDIRTAGSAMQTRTDNRTFLFDSRLQWGADAPTRLVMRLDVDTTRRDDTEGLLASTVAATVWQIDPSGKRQSLWSLKEAGDSGEIAGEQPLFVVRQSGCCGARDSYTVFGLYNGRRLFSATGNGPSDCWATLDVPNSGGLVRLIALHAAYSATDDTAFGARKETVGLLTYAAPDKPLARYRLVAKDASAVEGFMGAAEVRLVETGKTDETDSLTLWPADHKTEPAAIGGFAIKLHHNEGNTVRIPVIGDKLDLGAATLPAGLKIEPASLP